MLMMIGVMIGSVLWLKTLKDISRRKGKKGVDGDWGDGW
jgi:hypothetical protein